MRINLGHCECLFLSAITHLIARSLARSKCKNRSA